MTGFECLVRWVHPTQGMIRPDRFIAIAEDSGLIVPIGSWVLKFAVEQLRRWHERYPDGKALAINVNLSKSQLLHPGLIEYIESVLATTGLDASTLTLEITESMVMDNDDVVTPVLHRLRQLGVKLAMDDFGTGHSSLSNLYRFPIDVLKIDRAFINVMDRHRGYPAIVHAIVTLAHNLHMSVVAEGIETTSQIAQLQALECDRGQGYVFAKPLDAIDAEQRISMRHPQIRSAG